MHFYDNELIEIAHAVNKFKEFADSQMDYKNIDIEWPTEFEVKFDIVLPRCGLVGHIGFTDDGEIGFVAREEIERDD